MKRKILRWINNHITGKLLVAGYKAEKEAGDDHQALHSLAAVVHGNSDWCSDNHCYEYERGHDEAYYLRIIAERSK